MKNKSIFAAILVLAAPVSAQITTTGKLIPNGPEPVPVQETHAVATQSMMRDGTLVMVTPSQEISSKHVKVGEQYRFQVVNDVVEGKTVVIPRGSTVMSSVTFKTGRAIGGKSGKFELSFDSVSVNGKSYKLTGTWRQEGRGNSVGALLGSMVISGRSAVMLPGQLVNVFTAQPIPY